MRTPIVVDVFGMHFDDLVADMAGIGVSGHVLANFEPIRHYEPTIAV